MPAAAGRSLVLKKGVSPAGVLIASCRTASLKINNETVDISTKDTGAWRALLANAGISNASISLAGLVNSSATADALLTDAIDGSIDAYYLEFSSGDLIVGSFQVTDYEVGGGYNDSQEFSCTLASSGAITYTNT